MKPSSLFPVAAALCALPLLMSCTTEPLVVDPDLKGTIHLVILDANTSAPVSDVEVEIVGETDDETATTGEVTFSDLRAGAYFVRLSKKGYESSQEPVTLGTSGTQEVAALYVSQTFRIHRIGASVKGRVLMRPVNGPDTTAVIAGAGVKVELRSTAAGTGSGNTIYIVPLRTATTSATGHFTFDSLPEISGYTITIPEFTSGTKNFSLAATAVASGNLVAGQQYTHPNILLNPAATGTLQVFARSGSLVSNQPMVLEFSAAVDTSKLPAGAIQLRAGASNVNSTRTWNAGLTVLSVTPATGTWLGATTYSVVLTGVRDQQNRLLATTTITALPTP
jgi:hypothetical protein